MTDIVSLSLIIAKGLFQTMILMFGSSLMMGITLYDKERVILTLLKVFSVILTMLNRRILINLNKHSHLKLIKRITQRIILKS